MLVDTFGRTATDLRVSLTDRCNLRCTYCMPAEGLPWLPKAELLTDEEILRLIGIAVRFLGVDQVRFTGGEPLIRPRPGGLVAEVARLEPRPRISLTTNALGLARLAPTLKDAGLDRVNVSLDTLDPAVFRELTRRDRFADVGRRPGGRGRRRADPGEGEQRAHARRQRRRGPGPAPVVPGARLRAALHRADAAGRPARLGPLADGDRRRDPDGPAPGVRADPRGRGGPRRGAGRDLARGRRPRAGRA